tara:strand:+ start:205 stop:462 length:258 start_codon:yes stop_codon:yes gene_type:complete
MTEVFPIFHHAPGDLVNIYGSLCVITRRLTRKEILSFVGLGPYDIIVLPKWIHFGTYEFYRFKDGKTAICRGDYIQSIPLLDKQQ